MKLPTLKIRTKDLPLVALGITAVLMSAMFRQPLIRYLLIAMFFGVLSKETRWTFWGMVLLIDVFNAFKIILRTDYHVVVMDTITKMSYRISYSIVTNSSVNVLNNTSSVLNNAPYILNSSSMALVGDVLMGLVMGLENNPILNSPAVATIILGVFFICFLPVWGHTVSMSYIFHRKEIIDMLDMMKSSIIEEQFISEPIISSLARLITPYLIQGIAIQVVLMAAILPLIFYRILKWVGFYKRIPNIQSWGTGDD